jgi:hypothetical protein
MVYSLLKATQAKVTLAGFGNRALTLLFNGLYNIEHHDKLSNLFSKANFTVAI